MSNSLADKLSDISTLGEQCNCPRGARRAVAMRLQNIAQMMLGALNGERDDSIAWRLADAAQEFRRVVEAEWPGVPIAGVTEPTGLGAMLPTSIGRGRE